jgi:probable rRNA maturation factor
LRQKRSFVVDVRSEGALAPALRALVRRAVSETLRAEGVLRGCAAVYLVGDRRIRELNRSYLKKDRPTDVIAFWLEPEGLCGPEAGHLGDLAVSVERARKVSLDLGIPFPEELARYAVHGTLHLLGYRDGRAADRGKMILRQEAVLKRLKVRSLCRNARSCRA